MMFLLAMTISLAASMQVVWGDADEKKPNPVNAGDSWYVQPPVTARDYYDYSQTYPEPILNNADKHGIYGPRHGLSALAAYHFTKDRKYADALLKAMRGYDEAIRQQIKDNQGVHYSWEGPYLWGLILRELRKDKLLTAEDERFASDMLVRLADTLSSWSPTLNWTRGQQHRAQGESCARMIALTLYPALPQAEKWKKYSDTVWNDWWQFRDLGINDTGYFYGALQRVMLTAELLNREEVWKDPQMKDFWERLMYEVAPDGSTIPYGASSGWNSSVGDRILAMELAAKHTGDGRYRWVAHRMFNYLRARQGTLPKQNHVFATTVEPICLAAVLADDRIKPVQPEASSRVLLRKEVTRLTESQAKEQYPGYGILDCNMGMSQKLMPHKIIFRSGWKPTDLFMMVEAFPRHDPLNPSAILGLNCNGSAMTIMSSEKFVSRENEVMIDDPTKAATYLHQKGYKGDRAVPTGYAGMETKVEPFIESPLATYARLNVTNYMGYEVEHSREFLFIKNRFVLVHDRSHFLEGFPCRLGPVWNTQKIESQGANWVNCYFEYAASLPPAAFENPRWDLLVFHSPKGDRKLEVSNREGNLAEFTAPNSTRYVWEGTSQADRDIEFSWLLVPHDPTRSATDLVSRIEFLKDEPQLVVVRLETEKGRAEWMVLNEEGKRIELSYKGNGKALTTDARRLYLDCRNGKPVRSWAVEATVLRVGKTEVYRSKARKSVSVGKAED